MRKIGFTVFLAMLGGFAGLRGRSLRRLQADQGARAQDHHRQRDGLPSWRVSRQTGAADEAPPHSLCLRRLSASWRRHRGVPRLCGRAGRQQRRGRPPGLSQQDAELGDDPPGIGAEPVLAAGRDRIRLERRPAGARRAPISANGSASCSAQILFIGFFLALLMNSGAWAKAIVASFQTAADRVASGQRRQRRHEAVGRVRRRAVPSPTRSWTRPRSGIPPTASA